MPDYVLGIDIGTGSTKSLAVDFTGKILSTAQVHYPTLRPAPGHSEQAPEIVWQAFVKSVSRLTKQHAAPRAIVLSSAMHSVIPVDSHGNPLANMMTWADNRSGDVAIHIRESSSGEMLYEQTGTPIHAMTPLCKLAWLREHAAPLFSSTHKFISIKEFIWHKLFGAFEVDHSIASATGLIDIHKLAWSQNALDAAGITPDHLSTLVSPSFTRKDCDKAVAVQLGINNSTAFMIGASDGCLANLGSFATAPGAAALTIGTSGAVRVASKKPVFDFTSMIFNYRLDGETFICGGPTNNGGSALRWYVENFLDQRLETVEDYDAVLKTIQFSEPGAEGLIFLPYVLGERAPIWNSKASAAFFGMNGTHSRSHFTRAVVEGISFALYDIAEHMMSNGLPIDRIHVSGGFVRSPEWLQLLANVFEKKVCLLNAEDASAVGAAYLGLKTLGIIPDYESLHPEMLREFLPESPYSAVYRETFKRYRQLYQHISPLMV